METMLIIGYFGLLLGFIALVSWVKHTRKVDIQAWYESYEREFEHARYMRNNLNERLRKLEQEIEKDCKHENKTDVTTGSSMLEKDILEEIMDKLGAH